MGTVIQLQSYGAVGHVRDAHGRGWALFVVPYRDYCQCGVFAVRGVCGRFRFDTRYSPVSRRIASPDNVSGLDSEFFERVRNLLLESYEPPACGCNAAFFRP